MGFALIASWFVAVIFTPYLGVKMLPDIKPIPRRSRCDLRDAQLPAASPTGGLVDPHKFIVAGAVVAVFVMAGVGMGRSSGSSSRTRTGRRFWSRFRCRKGPALRPAPPRRKSRTG